MMRAVLFEPLEPYPGGNHLPWRCRCTGCGPCGTAAAGLRRRTAPGVAESQLRAGGFEPLEPYPGLASRPWRCRCLSCGSAMTAPLYEVRNGIGVCSGCASWAST